jgi:hypothetical protein
MHACNRSSKGRAVQWRLPAGIGRIAAEDDEREGTPQDSDDEGDEEEDHAAAAQEQQQQLQQQRRFSNGLASIAEAVEQASPFVPLPKPGTPAGAHFLPEPEPGSPAPAQQQVPQIDQRLDCLGLLGPPSTAHCHMRQESPGLLLLLWPS